VSSGGWLDSLEGQGWVADEIEIARKEIANAAG
jgi:hypothetical protein